MSSVYMMIFSNMSFLTPCLELLEFIKTDPYNNSQKNLFSFINFLKGNSIWKYTQQ